MNDQAWIFGKAISPLFADRVTNADVNDEELMTTFCGAEALINSRPLTYQSASVKDNIPLTPFFT